MEAEALAASLQRSREQIRSELLSDEGASGADLLAGLVPRSGIMSFLLAPERRGLMLTALSTLLSFAGRSRGRSGGGFGGWRSLLWLLPALFLRRR